LKNKGCFDGLRWLYQLKITCYYRNYNHIYASKMLKQCKITPPPGCLWPPCNIRRCMVNKKIQNLQCGGRRLAFNGINIKGLLNGHLRSPQSKYQISNYHLPYRKLGFFSINTHICALNQGAHTSFSKIIFRKQIKMSLVLVYNWHETAVFTKYKHIILHE
jgi:hypothetical protein